MNAGRAEAAFWAAFLRNRNVDAGTAGDGAVALAGGYALCVAGTLIERAVGAGSTRPLREDDCEVAESFYAVRRLPARFELDEDVLVRDEPLLHRRGYADEDLVVAVLSAPVGPRPPAAPGRIHVRQTTDRRAWAELVTRAADAPAAERDVLLRTSHVYASAAHGLVVASIDGEDVGAAALGMSGETALLYAGAVLPAFRGGGVYGELVTARMAIAHALGTAVAVMKAAPDGPAERSARRRGFERTGLRRRVVAAKAR